MSIPREGSRDTDQGLIISKYPDFCKAPVSPIPFCSIGIQADDANTCTTVRQTKMRAHNMGSLVTCCTGDEPGTGLGVKSQTVGSICEPLEHSGTVRFEGKNAIRNGDLWYINNRNTTGPLIYVKDQVTYSTIYDDKVAEREERPDRETHDLPAASKSGANRTEANRLVLSDASPYTFEAGKEYALNGNAAKFEQNLKTPVAPPVETPKPQTPAAPAKTPTYSFPPQTPTPKTSTQTGVVARPGVGAFAGMGSSGDAAFVASQYFRIDAIQRNISEAEEHIPVLNNEYGFRIDPANDYHVNAVVSFVEDIHAREPTAIPGIYGQNIYTEQEAIDRLRERIDREDEIARTETPSVELTTDNSRTTEDQTGPPDCRVLPYEQLRGTCGPNEQAHHIIPSYTHHYGNRPQAMKELSQVGDGGGVAFARPFYFPSFWEAPAICLKGHAGTQDTQHWQAHRADAIIAGFGQNGGPNPKGTAPFGLIREAAELATIAAKRGCETQIRLGVATGYDSVPDDALGRATKALPTGDALMILQQGGKAQ